MKAIKNVLYGVFGMVVFVFTSITIVLSFFTLIGQMFFGLFMQGYEDAKRKRLNR
jgi:hypothetical protein